VLLQKSLVAHLPGVSTARLMKRQARATRFADCISAMTGLSGEATSTFEPTKKRAP